MKERDSFKSRLGFILVSAGCAIGLGNVWKFPYICGENGGAAFVVIYLVFLLVLGLPILICEFAVGRASRKGTSRAFEELEPEGSRWHHFKWISIFGSYLLMMFYTMVGGWMIRYAVHMGTGKFQGLGPEGVKQRFVDMQTAPGDMTFWMILTVVISMAVCAMGLQNGIEKITKIMMSILIILMLVLAIRSLVLEGAGEGVRFYMVPNFKAMAEHGIGNVIFAAMTHAFFTLSVGIGCMEIFGSYLKKDRTLLPEAVSVLTLDTFVALMAGFIIVPACFAFGIRPDAGPSLLFLTLPNVFNSMGFGRLWGTCFFIFMSFAALSTVIAVFENILSFYMDMGGWSRKKAVCFNLPLIILLSVPAVLGFNLLSGFQPLGAGTTVMDLEDFLVSYNLLPLGSLAFVLFCTHRNGWGWNQFLAEANAGTGLRFPRQLRGYVTYVLPAVIAVVYLKGYYDTFASKGTGMLVGWMIFAVVLLALIFGITMLGVNARRQVRKGK